MITDSKNGHSPTPASPSLAIGIDPPLTPAPITSMNFDILTNICGFLDAGAQRLELGIRPSWNDFYHIRLSKNDLLCTALVCKTFVGPALDSLWRSMDSIVPLLRLLPTLEVIDDVYMLRGKVKDEDMSRFKSYAQRIRIYSRMETGIQLAPFTLTQLPLPLLPALRHLRWSSYRLMVTSGATALLLSPTLEHFTLMDVTCENRDIGPFLHTLQIQAPDLKALVFHGTVNAKTLDSVFTFGQLRFLRLSGNLPFVLFQQIAALPELRSLDVELVGSSLSNAPHTESIMFTKLETLIIAGSPAHVASYFLHMRGGCLKNIAFLSKFAGMRELGHWEDCLSAMNDQWAETLRFLVLRSFRSHQEISPQFFLSLSSLRLERLQIIGRRLSMRQCKELLSKIPRIKELCICVSSHPMLVSPWWLLDLFAHSCRDATLLQIYFEKDISDTAVPPPHDYSGIPHGLKTLVMNHDGEHFFGDLTEQQHTLNMASYLDHLFPYLQTLRGTGYDSYSDSESAEFWGHVYDIIHRLQGARRDER